ncbi:Glycosyltransferase [Lachnospiraceae bacterium TWA4]|nr:Glycosyltransferase [Lachnospiraceae bacterium TWA4]
MDLKILVVTHKKYRMPKDKVYIPIGVGGYKHPHYLSDSVGENTISRKNPNYCELTALYWAWKNLDYEYLGLTHYRRHFSAKNRLFQRKYGKFASIASSKEIKNFLEVQISFYLRKEFI